MLRFLICCLLIFSAFSSLTITTQNYAQCSCPNAKASQDCLSQYCIWDSGTSTCSNKNCSSFGTKIDCQALPDPFKCAWDETNNSCITFTKCSDFSFDITKAQQDCADLEMCQEDLDSSNSTTGKRKCMNKSINAIRSTSDCTKVDYNTCYWIIQTDGKQCLQNTQTQKCAAYTITKCSDYSLEQCNAYACTDVSGVCTQRSCNSFESFTLCYQYFSYDLQSITLCKWVNNACTDMDPSTLTRDQCMGSTLNSYIWNPDTSKCELCSVSSPTSEMSTKIFQAILILFMII